MINTRPRLVTGRHGAAELGGSSSPLHTQERPLRALPPRPWQPPSRVPVASMLFVTAQGGVLRSVSLSAAAVRRTVTRRPAVEQGRSPCLHGSYYCSAPCGGPFAAGAPSPRMVTCARRGPGRRPEELPGGPSGDGRLLSPPPQARCPPHSCCLGLGAAKSEGIQG